MTQQTSIISWIEIQDTLGKRQLQVLNALKKGKYTNTEIAVKLNRPINCIVPRTNELVKLGFVIENCKRVCRETGRIAIEWRVK